MTVVLRERLAESLRAFRGVFGNRNLRRLELAWAGSITGEWASAVALGTVLFADPGAAARVREELAGEARQRGFADPLAARGVAHADLDGAPPGPVVRVADGARKRSAQVGLKV